LFAILAIVAIVALALAAAVNWVWSPSRQTLTENQPAGSGGLYQPAPLHLDQPAIDLLPETILSFETLARQPVAGQADTAAEAIYVTLNMDIEEQVATNTYARIEGFATDVEAKKRVDELVNQYPLRQATQLVNGVTSVKFGYNATGASYTALWTRGQYMVMVKTSFAQHIPADKRDILGAQLRPVVDAVDKFQRTGKQGINQ